MAFIDTPETQKANRRFIRAAMKIPLLEKQEEHDLARKWREDGDEASLHKLVKPYMRLVISTATRFRSYGLPVGDLVQEGNIGLMQAAAKFEPEREVRFSTYATWWIRSSMQEYVLRNWSIVRTGTTAAQKSLFFNLRRLKARIATGDGSLNDAGREEIARCLKVSMRDVLMMEGRMSGNDRSLNTPVGENGESEWQDFLADDRPDPEALAMSDHDSQVRHNWIEAAVGELNPREQVIIRERRLSEDSLTLETLGHSLGISKERVRQIEQEALNKLKASLLKQSGDASVAGLLYA